MDTRTCWFDFEGENKGDEVEASSDARAARIYYGTWKDEVDEGTRVFVRSSLGVTEWSVYETKLLVSRQLNVDG